MTGTPRAELAQALAYGMLAGGDWTQRGLEAAGRRTLGRWHHWLRPLVGEVRETYRAPPADRPRELAGLIAACGAFVAGTEEAAAGGRHLTAVHLGAGPPEMGPSRWDVPAASDHAALAGLLEVLPDHLTWLADLQGRQRRTPAGPYQVSCYRWVSRSGSVPRLLEAPTPLLRAPLRRLLSTVLDRVPAHPAAHDFVTGRSAITHAGVHVGSEVVLSLDLRNFFAAVAAGRAYGLFRLLGYPEPVAHTLAGLVTNQVPGPVLGRMPPGGDPSARHRLRAWLRTPHLPQGAPSFT